jgi:hypothetical protein
MDLGVASLAGADDVGRCLVAQHACSVDRLVAFETPRALELLALAGLAPATVLPCALPSPTGTGAGLGARDRIVDACQRAIQKADAKLVSGTTAALRRCATQVLACRQQKPTDPTCLAKAQVTCPKLRAEITRLKAKLATTIAKKCDAPLLANAELLGAAGAGFQSEAGFCKALGVPSLASIGALTDCLTRHEQCRAQQLVERELPRLDELLATGGVVFP